MKSRPEFTSQQAAAIYSKGVSVALSAGAGCGKTFVLTQRFLAGLEPSVATDATNDLHRLVAITFTERAAREMRDRIRTACVDRLQASEPADVEHWIAILRGLDSARVSTIHSFCTGLLRSQAVEAELDPRFQVLEPALADTLLRRVIRDGLHQMIETSDADATDLVVQFGLERAKELLQRLVQQRFQIDFSRFQSLSPEQLATEWLQRWNLIVVPKLIKDFRQSVVVQRVLQAIDGSPSKNEVLKQRIATLQSHLLTEMPWKNAAEVLQILHEQARVVGGGGKKDWASEDHQEQVKLAFEKLRKAVSELSDCLNYEPEDVARSAELACRAVRLTNSLANQYSQSKHELGVLDFDDLLLRARNLLRDHQPVRDRVASGIRLLMVDEFQDTDPVQADVVRSLCGTALKHGKLFMVGDRKQSIYRFRRADPTVFATMSHELPESGRLPLNVNFRSQPAILKFVNQLFATAIDDYDGLVPHDAIQDSPVPSIEFLFATYDADGADAPPAESTGSGLSPGDDDLRANASELRSREADWIARRITALLNDPTKRIRTRAKTSDGRPELRRVQPGDIVILFRALSNVQEYEAALRRYGLHYYLVGGKAFFAQQEVFDLLNLCRYLDDCDDEVALAGLLRSPFFNLSDDAIQALVLGTDQPAEDLKGRHKARPLHEVLYLKPAAWLPEEQRSRIRFAAEVLSELRSIKDRVPLVNLLNRAIEQTGYDAALLAEFLGSRKLANLRKLIEIARQFDQAEFSSLKDFVFRLQTSVLEETDEEFATTLPESSAVIRLMSIHQSKGLEFPVVIVADIDRKGPPRGGDSVLHPELGPLVKLPQQFGRRPENLALRMHQLAEKEAEAAESIRLFYVACTRAADYLILSAGFDEQRPSHSSWMDLVQSRFDASTGLLKFDSLLGASDAGGADRQAVPDVLVHHHPCPVKIPESLDRKQIPVGELPGRILSASPSDFPDSMRVIPRDTGDSMMTSVSRLEAIDLELHGGGNPHSGRPSPEQIEEGLDLDMATALGMIIHSVLERVDFHHPDSWPDLLETIIAQSSAPPGDQVIKQARNMLARFFKSSFVDEFAGATSLFREIDFLIPWPATVRPLPPELAVRSSDVTIAGVIDLLIETSDGWAIFDYKTGEFPESAENSSLLAAYELQLVLYAQAVEQWFGVTPRELSLIVFRPVVRRIVLERTAAKCDEIRQRVDRAIDWQRKSMPSIVIPPGSQ